MAICKSQNGKSRNKMRRMKGNGGWNEGNMGNVGNQGGNVQMQEIKVGLHKMEWDAASQGRIVWEVGLKCR